jgi:hypothetical protein
VNAFWFGVLGFSVLRVGKAAANEPSRRISLHEGMRLVATPSPANAITAERSPRR